jgi:hypothetical protein
MSISGIISGEVTAPISNLFLSSSSSYNYLPNIEGWNAQKQLYILASLNVTIELDIIGYASDANCAPNPANISQHIPLTKCDMIFLRY